MISWIIMGVLAGFIANKLTSGEGKGFILNLFLGVIGSIVGGWLFGILGINAENWVGELITSTIGAAVVLWIRNKLF